MVGLAVTASGKSLVVGIWGWSLGTETTCGHQPTRRQGHQSYNCWDLSLSQLAWKWVWSPNKTHVLISQCCIINEIITSFLIILLSVSRPTQNAFISTLIPNKPLKRSYTWYFVKKNLCAYHVSAKHFIALVFQNRGWRVRCEPLSHIHS